MVARTLSLVRHAVLLSCTQYAKIHNRHASGLVLQSAFLRWLVSLCAHYPEHVHIVATPLPTGSPGWAHNDTKGNVSRSAVVGEVCPPRADLKRSAHLGLT